MANADRFAVWQSQLDAAPFHCGRNNWQSCGSVNLNLNQLAIVVGSAAAIYRYRSPHGNGRRAKLSSATSIERHIELMNGVRYPAQCLFLRWTTNWRIVSVDGEQKRPESQNQWAISEMQSARCAWPRGWAGRYRNNYHVIIAINSTVCHVDVFCSFSSHMLEFFLRLRN